MLLGSELLARLRACVVLIDEERRLLHVNQAASSLLGSSDVMAQSDDRLFCRRTIDDNALAMGLRELLRENRSAVEALLRSHDQRARKGRSAVTRTRRHVS
jgi:sensor histidine kinase regulating citrate/malate metabolism